LGFGDWVLGPIPNPQSPIPNPQSPYTYLMRILYIDILIINLNLIFELNLNKYVPKR